MNRLYLIVALLVVLLAADLGWKAWSERPYLVTGYSVVAAGSGTARRTEFRLPGGGVGQWQVSLPQDNTVPSPQALCWSRARIGSTIPDCMWSFNEIDRR